MGDSDHDDVSELRADSFDTERPFAPPEEQSISSGVLFLSLLVVVFLGFELYQSASESPVPPRPEVSAPAAIREARVPQPPRQAPQEDVAVKPQGTITRCVQNGITTYSDQGCTGVSELIALNPDRNLADALPREKVELSAADQPAASSPSVVSTTPADPTANRHPSCDSLEAEVRSIDAQARQPLTPQWQDFLAAKRKEVRDLQFRLHC